MPRACPPAAVRGDQCAHEPALARRDQASETRDRDRVALEPGQPGLRGQQLARPQHGAARQRHGPPGRVRRHFQRPQRRIGAAGRPDRRARSRDTHPPARSAIAACSANRSNGTPSALASARPGLPAASRSDSSASSTYFGLAAHPLDIRAADELAQESAPPPHALGRCVPYDERLDAAAPATTVITARLAKAPQVQPRSGRRHDANRGHRGAVVDHGRDRPAGQRRRLALERHVHVLAVASADFAQRQWRGAECSARRASRAISARTAGRLRSSTRNTAPSPAGRCLVSPGQGRGRGRSPLTSRIV